MDWVAWLIVSLTFTNAFILVLLLWRNPGRHQVVLQSDVEGRLRTLTRLSDEERDLVQRALTGMPASRYWYLIALLDEIEKGRRSADLLCFEAYRHESDTSLAS